MFANLEAEIKALIIKVLEELDLYHPPVSTADAPPSDVSPEITPPEQPK